MVAHSSVLAWRIPGRGEPGGLPSMGSHRVGHDCSDLAVVAAVFLSGAQSPLLNSLLVVRIQLLGIVELCFPSSCWLLLESVLALRSCPQVLTTRPPPPTVYVLVTQSCPTLCDPMKCSPPGSSGPWDFPARIYW